MLTRRSFIKQSSLGAAALSASSFASFNPKEFLFQKGKTLKLSLAQWSIHRAINAGQLKAGDFASIASKDYGIKAIEYVNSFYKAFGKDEKFWSGMKQRALDAGVSSLLIMVDEEGDLGNPSDAERKIAVENHFKWVNAAKILGCHSIRVNAFGDGYKEIVRDALLDGIALLADYSSKVNINIIIENHGLYSSDGRWLTGIIREINKPNVGTLPDFGNWCLTAKWGSTQFDNCKDAYDRYLGVADFLPFAKGVSAKSYRFDSKGNETKIDYYRMLRMVKDSQFDGYIGIEYEGETHTEPEGIRLTKALLEKVWKSLT